MTETFGEKEEKSEPPPAKELKTVKFIRASCIASLLVVKTITETKEDSLVASLCEGPHWPAGFDERLQRGSVIFSVVNLQHHGDCAGPHQSATRGQRSPNPPTPPPFPAETFITKVELQELVGKSFHMTSVRSGSGRSSNLFSLDRRYQDKTTKVTGANRRIKVFN